MAALLSIGTKGSNDPTDTGTTPENRHTVTADKTAPPRRQSGPAFREAATRIRHEACHGRKTRSALKAFALGHGHADHRKQGNTGPQLHCSKCRLQGGQVSIQGKHGEECVTTDRWRVAACHRICLGIVTQYFEMLQKMKIRDTIMAKQRPSHGKTLRFA